MAQAATLAHLRELAKSLTKSRMMKSHPLAAKLQVLAVTKPGLKKQEQEQEPKPELELETKTKPELESDPEVDTDTDGVEGMPEVVVDDDSETEDDELLKKLLDSIN